MSGETPPRPWAGTGRRRLAGDAGSGPSGLVLDVGLLLTAGTVL